MACKSKISFLGLGFLFFTFVLLLCLVIIQEDSDYVTGYGCYRVKVAMRNRKLLSVKELVKGDVHKKSSYEKEQDMEEDSELRMVPSGPDPLHHNGNPKKPRTP